MMDEFEKWLEENPIAMDKQILWLDSYLPILKARLKAAWDASREVSEREHKGDIC